MPCFNYPFTVYVDASNVAVGAIPTQQYNKTDMHICYFSKQLNPTEAWWTIYKYEIYADII